MSLVNFITSVFKGEELVLFSQCLFQLHHNGRPLAKLPVRRIVRWAGNEYTHIAISDERGVVRFEHLKIHHSILSSASTYPVEQQIIVNYEKRDWMLWICKKQNDYVANGEMNGKPLTFKCNITSPSKPISGSNHEIRSRFLPVNLSVRARGQLTAA